MGTGMNYKLAAKRRITFFSFLDFETIQTPMYILLDVPKKPLLNRYYVVTNS